MLPTSQQSTQHSNIKPVAHYQPKEPLQDRYAHRILELQYRVETLSNGQECLPQLMTLYTRAIQFHQGIGSIHFKLYQKRMEAFLKRENIDQMLRGTSTRLANRKQETLRSIELARMQSKLAVSKLIQNSEKQFDRINNIVQKSMNHQQQSLEQRLKKRRTLSNISTVSSGGQVWQTSGQLPLLKALHLKLAQIQAEYEVDSIDE